MDIDCVESDRPQIFQYITNRFGDRKTARVAAFGTIKARGVVDDVGRYLAKKWDELNPNNPNNPWSLKNIATIKNEFDADEEKTRTKYPQLFYYFDGLLNTKISQSIHPAGMVISPITLDDNFGTFNKDGDSCLMLDMDNIHDYTGLAKYDFLVLKTIQVINDVCRYANISYPKSHEIDWEDEEVWDDLCKNQDLIFQFESPFAADCLKKYAPKNIFDMSLVTACIRPSGASYRNDLLSHKEHKNPSELIDRLLENNNGYLIYQEDIIAFLQQICGLSGSEADTVRRGIGRKKKEILDAAMPSILAGYCNKSTQPREVAEAEAREFLQIIEDASSYMFGYNHSIAYCMLGYLCAYYRHYYPIEYITSFLNNAANDDDIQNGTSYANKVKISITSPKWGASLSHYFYNKDKGLISKGLASIKYMGKDVGQAMYDMSKAKEYTCFTDIIIDALSSGCVDTKQMDILIKIDFFSEFGNQRELLTIADLVINKFKKGECKQIKKSAISGMSSDVQDIVKKYSSDRKKDGSEAASYKVLDMHQILIEIEDKVKGLNMSDIPVKTKIQNFYDVAGYIGYVSGKAEDRRRLYVMDTFQINSKKDGTYIGERIITKSIGTGKESSITVWNSLYRRTKPVGYELCDGTQTKYIISERINKGDLIELVDFSTTHSERGINFVLEGFRKIY